MKSRQGGGRKNIYTITVISVKQTLVGQTTSQGTEAQSKVKLKPPTPVVRVHHAALTRGRQFFRNPVRLGQDGEKCQWEQTGVGTILID